MDGWNFQYEGDDAVGVGPAAGLPKRSATATLPAESRKSYIDSVDAGKCLLAAVTLSPPPPHHPTAGHAS